MEVADEIRIIARQQGRSEILLRFGQRLAFLRFIDDRVAPAVQQLGEAVWGILDANGCKKGNGSEGALSKPFVTTKKWLRGAAMHRSRHLNSAVSV